MVPGTLAAGGNWDGCKAMGQTGSEMEQICWPLLFAIVIVAPLVGGGRGREVVAILLEPLCIDEVVVDILGGEPLLTGVVACVVELVTL